VNRPLLKQDDSERFLIKCLVVMVIIVTIKFINDYMRS
jgi:hypothetical protein